MSLRIWGVASVIALLGLFGVPAAAAELPVTASLTTDSYTVTFAEPDADLSFTVTTNALTGLTTGGGWIVLSSGGKGSFGFAGGIKPDGTFTGHLVWINQDTGLRVTSTSLIAFAPGCSSTITGSGDSNFGPVNFTVTVTDSGEPGSNDTFSIVVTGSVSDSQSGTLAGGDIQVHGLSCP
jgi:hypothetical protein